jgi:hypothetical protein
MFTRRDLLQFASVALSAKPFPQLARLLNNIQSDQKGNSLDLPEQYPAYTADLIKTIITVAHFHLNKLNDLIDPHPHLVKSAWTGALVTGKRLWVRPATWEDAISGSTCCQGCDSVAVLLGAVRRSPHGPTDRRAPARNPARGRSTQRQSAGSRKDGGGSSPKPSWITCVR